MQENTYLLTTSLGHQLEVGPISALRVIVHHVCYLLIVIEV